MSNFYESAIVTYTAPDADYFCWVVSMVHGQPHEVEFDFEKIWSFRRGVKSFHPKYLNFYHVHPIGMPTYSDVDRRCLKGLNLAFNYPVWFSIIMFENSFPNNKKNQIHHYQMIDDEMVENENIRNDHPGLTTSQVAMLKTLSFYEYW